MHTSLWNLLEQTKKQPQLLQKIWETKQHKDPALALCMLCTQQGFPITVGELFAEGEEYTSNLLKSCNGGATYPLNGWEDGYDLFFAALEKLF